MITVPEGFELDEKPVITPPPLPLGFELDEKKPSGLITTRSGQRISLEDVQNATEPGAGMMSMHGKNLYQTPPVSAAQQGMIPQVNDLKPPPPPPVVPPPVQPPVIPLVPPAQGLPTSIPGVGPVTGTMSLADFEKSLPMGPEQKTYQAPPRHELRNRPADAGPITAEPGHIPPSKLDPAVLAGEKALDLPGRLAHTLFPKVALPDESGKPKSGIIPAFKRGMAEMNIDMDLRSSIDYHQPEKWGPALAKYKKEKAVWEKMAPRTRGEWYHLRPILENAAASSPGMLISTIMDAPTGEKPGLSIGLWQRQGAGNMLGEALDGVDVNKLTDEQRKAIDRGATVAGYLYSGVEQFNRFFGPKDIKALLEANKKRRKGLIGGIKNVTSESLEEAAQEAIKDIYVNAVRAMVNDSMPASERKLAIMKWNEIAEKAGWAFFQSIPTMAIIGGGHAAIAKAEEAAFGKTPDIEEQIKAKVDEAKTADEAKQAELRKKYPSQETAKAEVTSPTPTTQPEATEGAPEGAQPSAPKEAVLTDGQAANVAKLTQAGMPADQALAAVAPKPSTMPQDRPAAEETQVPDQGAKASQAPEQAAKQPISGTPSSENAPAPAAEPPTGRPAQQEEGTASPTPVQAGATSSGQFDAKSGPFTVEWGTRSGGNKSETFDDFDESVTFADRKGRSADFVTVIDRNGNERIESEEAPAPKPQQSAAVAEKSPELMTPEERREQVNSFGQIKSDRIREIATQGGCGEVAARVIERVGGEPLLAYDAEGNAVHAAVRLPNGELFDIGDNDSSRLRPVSIYELNRARRKDFDPDRVNIRDGEIDAMLNQMEVSGEDIPPSGYVREGDRYVFKPETKAEKFKKKVEKKQGGSVNAIPVRETAAPVVGETPGSRGEVGGQVRDAETPADAQEPIAGVGESKGQTAEVPAQEDASDEGTPEKPYVEKRFRDGTTLERIGGGKRIVRGANGYITELDPENRRDQGVLLEHSRNTKRETAEVKTTLESLKAKTPNANIEIIDSEDQAPKGSIAIGSRRGSTEGMYHNGTVYLIAENILPGHENRVFKHEVLVHAGLRGGVMRRLVKGGMKPNVAIELVEGRLSKILERSYLNKGRYKAEIQARMAADPTLSESAAAEELIADIYSRRNVAPGAWNRVVATLRNWLRKAAPNLTWSRNDIENLLAEGEDVVRGTEKGKYLSGSSEAFSNPGEINPLFSLKPANADTVRYSTRPQTSTPEFKAWFSGSKVVDKDGKPLVMYHGTKKSFDAFEVGAKGFNSNVFGSWKTQRAGIFFTDNAAEASLFATQGEEKLPEGANVVPAYLAIFDPIDLRNGFSDAQINSLESLGLNPRYYENIGPSQAWETFDYDEGGKELVAALKKMGHDGALINEPTSGDTDVTAWVAFDPTQIKSATGNRGTFDAENPDIRYSTRPETDYYSIHERMAEYRDEAVSDMVSSFKNHKGKGKWIAPWPLVSADRLMKIWTDYSKAGIVRDERGMDAISDQILKGIQRLDAANAISGHDTYDARQQILDMDEVEFSDAEWERFVDGMEDKKGNWRVSDYGLPKLQKLALDLASAKSSEDQLQVVDQILNVIHQRGDLSANFIEGGKNTLNKLFDAGVTEHTPGTRFSTRPESEAEGEIHGIRNASLEKQMEYLGMTPFEPVATRAWDGPVREEGDRIMKRNPAYVGNLINELLKDESKSMTDTETYMMLRAQVAAEASIRLDEQAVNKAREDKDPVAHAEALESFAQHFEELNRIYQAGKSAGTAAGRYLAARKMYMDDAYSFINMEREIRALSKGNPLVKELTEKLEKMSREIAESGARYEETIKEYKELAHDWEDTSRNYADMELILKGGSRRKVDIATRARVVEDADEFGAESLMELAVFKAKANVVRKSTRPSDGATPGEILDEAKKEDQKAELLRIMTKRGAYHILKGRRNKIMWKKAMRKDFAGVDIGDLIDEAYMASGRMAAKTVAARRSETVLETVRKPKPDAGPKDKPASVTDLPTIKELFLIQAQEMKEKGLKRDFDEALKNVTKILQERDMPEITEEQVRQLFTDYGKSQPATTEFVKLQMAWWRREGQLAESITRVARNLKIEQDKWDAMTTEEKKQASPLPTGRRRPKPTIKERILQKKLNALMKKSTFKPINQKARLASAVDAKVSRLKNRIEELDKAIKTEKKLPSYDPTKTTSPEIARLEKQRGALQKDYDKMFPPAPLTYQQKLEILIDRAERIEKELQASLANARKGIFRKRGPAPSTVGENPRLKTIQKRHEALRAEIKRLKELRTPKRSPEQIIADTFIARKNAAIKNMQKRAKMGDFGRREAHDISYSPEALAAKKRYEKAKLEYNILKEEVRRKNRTFYETNWERFASVWNTLRNVASSVDVSFVGRQGWNTFLSNPVIWAESVGPMLRSLNTNQSMIINTMIDNLPHNLDGTYKLAKLRLAQHDGLGGFVNIDDFKKLDYAGRLPVMGPLIEMSNRAYGTATNQLRTSLFDYLYNLYEFNPSSATYKKDVQALGEFVNHWTGKGDIGSSVGVVGQLMYAPSFVKAGFDVALGKGLFRGTKLSRRIALRQYARSWATVISIMLANYFWRKYFGDGRTISLDPRSSNFLTIPIGKRHRLGLSGPNRTAIVFLARLLSGRTSSNGEVRKLRNTLLLFADEDMKNSKIKYRQGMDSMIGRYLASKLHPGSQATRTLATGKNYRGDDVTLGGFALSLAPINPTQIPELYQTENPVVATYMAILLSLGADVNPDYEVMQREAESDDEE